MSFTIYDFQIYKATRNLLIRSNVGVLSPDRNYEGCLLQLTIFRSTKQPEINYGLYTSAQSSPILLRKINAEKRKQMEDLQNALNAHMDQMADLVEKLSAELRSGMKPAYENFMGFFHAIDWKEPWLIGLMSFYVLFLLVAFMSRRNINFQMCLFLLSLVGVYLAERINGLLAVNWERFAGQNYFDSRGLFVSVLWSGPLLVIAILILVNTLFSLCHLIVRWKRAELKHRARLGARKQE